MKQTPSEHGFIFEADEKYDLVRLSESGDILERKKIVSVENSDGLFEWVEMPETWCVALAKV